MALGGESVGLASSFLVVYTILLFICQQTESWENLE